MLLRFGKRRILYKADIEKSYRMRGRKFKIKITKTKEDIPEPQYFLF